MINKYYEVTMAEVPAMTARNYVGLSTYASQCHIAALKDRLTVPACKYESCAHIMGH